MRNFDKVLEVTDTGRAYFIRLESSEKFDVAAPDDVELWGDVLSVESVRSFWICKLTNAESDVSYSFYWGAGEFRTEDEKLAIKLRNDPDALKALIDEHSSAEPY